MPEQAEIEWSEQDRRDVNLWLLREADARVRFFPQRRDGVDALMRHIATSLPPLNPQVERGVECYHGTHRACESILCGSNCSHRFDRMHPCPACLIAELHDLRAALRVAGVDPYSVPRYSPGQPT